MPDSERKNLTEKAILEDESTFHPSGKAELLLSFDTFNPNIAKRTMGVYPHIGSKVYTCSDELISSFVNEFGAKSTDSTVGSFGVLSPNQTPCDVSLDSLFGRHCAVLGTTGGGKSWTLAKLMEMVQSSTSNKVILIDATGEYAKLSNTQHCVIGMDTYFPYAQLSNSDFCFLFSEHSPNSSTVLCEAINTLRLHKTGKLDSLIKIGKNANEILKIISNNIADCYNADFDISKLHAQIRNECIQEKNGNYAEDSFKLGYCSHLMARVNLFLNNGTVKFAFGIGGQNSNLSILGKIKQFIDSNNSILRIGFEHLSYDFAIREIIVDFIASQLLKDARKGSFKASPVLLFIDEAHQFLNKRINADDDTSFYLQGIELIAKEARKYGLFLCLSTQMPRDIPLGVLSQMGAFVAHRLINDQDRKAVESAASSANKTTLSFLPIMGAGEALLIGVDFPMPLLLKVGEPINKPQSDTPKLKKKDIKP